MSKRTVFTTLTPLPAGINRETVLETLHDHQEMIDLNPLVEERHPIKPPPSATAEEYHCLWYSLTDKVSYLPGGLMTGKVSYNACFHDLEMGLQTHVYAPMGLNIRGKWSLGGSLPGEPIAPVELGMGAPLQGLYLREDVDMKCNIMMTSFVKKTLKKAHSALVDRLLVKAQIIDASLSNQRINDKTMFPPLPFMGSQASTEYSRRASSDYDAQSLIEEANSGHFNPYGPGPQSPPLLQQSFSFRGPEHPDFRDKSNYNEQSLYPKALSLRSSSAGSMTGSQHGRSSYQESAQGSQNGRVSWQNLNPKHAPSIAQQAEPATYQNANGYRASSQSHHVEPPTYDTPSYESHIVGRQDSNHREPWRENQQYPSAHFGAFELE